MINQTQPLISATTMVCTIINDLSSKSGLSSRSNLVWITNILVHRCHHGRDPPCRSWPSAHWLACQTQMVLSSDPETILDPLGKNVTEWIQSLWPRRHGSISVSVLASQTRVLLLSEPRMILDPSGENATEQTQPLRPWSCSDCWGYFFSMPQTSSGS